MRIRIVRRSHRHSLQVIHQYRSSRPTISKHVTISGLHNAHLSNRLRTISNRVHILLNSRNLRRLNRLINHVHARHVKRSHKLNLQGSQRINKARTISRHKLRGLTVVNCNNNRRDVLRQYRRNISLTSEHRYRLIIISINKRLQHSQRPQNSNMVKAIRNSQTIGAGFLNRKQSNIITRQRTRLNRHNIQQVYRHILRKSLTIDTINLQCNINRLHSNTKGHMTYSYQGLHVQLMLTNFRDHNNRRHFRHKPQEVRLQDNSIRRQVNNILKRRTMITIHLTRIVTNRLIQIMTKHTSRNRSATNFQLSNRYNTVHTTRTIMYNLLGLQVSKHFSVNTLILLPNRRQLRPLPRRLLQLTQRRQTTKHFSTTPTALTSKRRSNSQHVRFTNKVKALMQRQVIKEVKFYSSQSIHNRGKPTQYTMFIMRHTSIAYIINRLINSSNRSSNNKRTRGSRRNRRSNRRLTRQLVRTVLLTNQSSTKLQLSRSSS